MQWQGWSAMALKRTKQQNENQSYKDWDEHRGCQSQTENEQSI